MSSLRQCVLLVALLSSNGAPSWFDPNPFIDPRHTKAVEDEYRAQIANMRVPTYEEAHTRAGQARLARLSADAHYKLAEILFNRGDREGFDAVTHEASMIVMAKVRPYVEQEGMEMRDAWLKVAPAGTFYLLGRYTFDDREGLDHETRFDHAAETYRRALERDPEHVGAMAWLANTIRLRAANYPDREDSPSSITEAGELYVKVLELDPEHPWAEAYLAEIRFQDPAWREQFAGWVALAQKNRTATNDDVERDADDGVEPDAEDEESNPMYMLAEQLFEQGQRDLLTQGQAREKVDRDLLVMKLFDDSGELDQEMAGALYDSATGYLKNVGDLEALTAGFHAVAHETPAVEWRGVEAVEFLKTVVEFAAVKREEIEEILARAEEEENKDAKWNPMDQLLQLKGVFANGVGEELVQRAKEEWDREKKPYDYKKANKERDELVRQAGERVAARGEL
mmetsp:Transcript_14289/g.42625  ORF Transcript_14289/g.42625 Transcript_14289/m.42625 type:complete len:454 (+) Transcript_14289:196-1557(+)